MRDSHKELAIKTAIQEYKNSVLFGFSSNTAHAINMMENVFIMCSCNIEGIEELRKTIKEAKEKYKNELGNVDFLIGGNFNGWYAICKVCGRYKRNLRKDIVTDATNSKVMKKILPYL